LEDNDTGEDLGYKPRELSKTARREMRVLELRAEGYGFDEIAARCGYANRGSAWKAYKRALASGDRVMTDENARTLELHRLELLTQAVWPAASRGDLSAVREAARLSMLRSKLLGLPVAPGRSGGRSSDDGAGEQSGVVIGPDRLDEMRERRQRDEAERTAGS
jgi:hypothetical protein